jgi:hypothetical protein
MPHRPGWVWQDLPMPTDVSLVAGATSLTSGARRALAAARRVDESRLIEEGNADRVDRALGALEHATDLLDGIMGPADGRSGEAGSPLELATLRELRQATRRTRLVELISDLIESPVLTVEESRAFEYVRTHVADLDGLIARIAARLETE